MPSLIPDGEWSAFRDFADQAAHPLCRPAGTAISAAADHRARCCPPLQREWLQQGRQASPSGCRPSRIASTISGPSRVNRQDAADIASVDLLRRRDLADGGITSVVQHPLPAERAGQRLHHGRVGTRGDRGRRGTPGGSDNRLPPRPWPDRQRHAHGDAAHPAHAAAATASSRAAPRSRTRLVKPVDAQPDVRAGRADLHALHQQPDDPRLLGRETARPTADPAAPAPRASRPRSGQAARPAPPSRCRRRSPAAAAAPGPGRSPRPRSPRPTRARMTSSAAHRPSAPTG